MIQGLSSFLRAGTGALVPDRGGRSPVVTLDLPDHSLSPFSRLEPEGLNIFRRCAGLEVGAQKYRRTGEPRLA